MSSSDTSEARRLIESAYADDRVPVPAAKPSATPAVEALLARHAEDARRLREYQSTQFDPHCEPAPVARPSEPMPAVAKGIALASLPVGGGVWMIGEGVGAAMQSATPTAAVCIVAAGASVALVSKFRAKQGPKRVTNVTDLRGASVTRKTIRGIAWKSGNS
ncbi:hypothetical protein ACOKM3_14195 [Streptomyces sp. BH106]|uniref:hypothetical protein n=1 Tax=Streptomyces sp. BH106 TaxID=3410409 RepID=UPI003CF0505F